MQTRRVSKDPWISFLCDNNLTELFGTGALGSAAQKVGAWVLLISTHAVFDGSTGPYRPDAAPSPLDAHGRSKALAERMLAEVRMNLFPPSMPVRY
jgi:dTDP-4-dehydrorhamnose reductase